MNLLTSDWNLVIILFNVIGSAQNKYSSFGRIVIFITVILPKNDILNDFHNFIIILNFCNMGRKFLADRLLGRSIKF